MVSSDAGDGPAAEYSVREGVAVITLNRPRAMNAVNSALSEAVGRALDSAAGDEAVRSVVITGKGRAFCAGADLKEVAARRPVHALEHPDWGFAGFVQHWIDKPTIAAVNGFAMGGGTEIALACDLVVSSSEATFGLPEVSRGLVAAAGGALRLQHQIPLRRALAMALTGEPIDAHTAYEWGLVNEVVPAETVLPAAVALATRIAANAPLAVQHTKRMMHSTSSSGSTWNPAWSDIDPWSANAASSALIFNSRDASEGATAFAEKRPPVWEGR